MDLIIEEKDGLGRRELRKKSDNQCVVTVWTPDHTGDYDQKYWCRLIEKAERLLLFAQHMAILMDKNDFNSLYHNKEYLMKNIKKEVDCIEHGNKEEMTTVYTQGTMEARQVPKSEAIRLKIIKK